ncbi:class I SAM-dependent methyltransferase [Fodinibius sediminis]|uniref:Methyltransferase domain-containing protein n=1 Tax=Fodinibius sediminis TaxID=1214077 RepID=A0A521CZE2_9BACT|nr:class I SAM-dependent methyltransferase [Fodinibius sediminis]SMO64827.1 Methyltransferase domain-containing protein [Fodinibius sediminis]
MNKQRDSAHTRSRYDLLAPVYNLMEWPLERLLFQSWRRELWREVEGPQVLEIGVGTGKNIPFYPDHITLTGIDLSPRMLARGQKELAKSGKKHVTLREMDAQQMNFEDHTFDEVVATFVFCSVPDAVAGLQEALRVTRPGGTLHLLEHMRSDHPLLGTVMNTIDHPLHYLSSVHIARRTVDNVEKAGWMINEVQPLSFTGIVKRIRATKAGRDVEHHADQE